MLINGRACVRISFTYDSKPVDGALLYFFGRFRINPPPLCNSEELRSTTSPPGRLLSVGAVSFHLTDVLRGSTPTWTSLPRYQDSKPADGWWSYSCWIPPWDRLLSLSPDIHCKPWCCHSNWILDICCRSWVLECMGTPLWNCSRYRINFSWCFGCPGSESSYLEHWGEFQCHGALLDVLEVFLVF